MRRAIVIQRAATLLVVMVAALTGATGGGVQAGQEFGGLFDWSDASYQGDDVWVRVTVMLVNRSGADVFDLTVTPEGVTDPNGHGELWVGAVADGSMVTVSGDVAVPGWELEGWEEGAWPLFRLDYTDASGTARQKRIAMTHMTLEER